jgi:hypothetical protein
MPRAKPAPDSAAHYSYWEKYLDYLVQPAARRKGRGPLPPNQDSDRISGFNNAGPAVPGAAPRGGADGHAGRIGYATYVQFMLDHGRDLKPDGKTYSPISPHSPLCPWHAEETPGGRMRFPPRAQPMHAARRALVAAIAAVQESNEGLDSSQADWVSVITFDTLTGGGPVVRCPLGADYDAAMRACARLEAAGDKSAGRATEAGLIAARRHIESGSEGGRGRAGANKVVVLLTGGPPDLYVTSPGQLDEFLRERPSPEFYGKGANPCDAALAQIVQMEAKRWAVFPVGVGPGGQGDFLDRMARLAATADPSGRGPHAAGSPSECQQRLTGILVKVLSERQFRLVQ